MALTAGRLRAFLDAPKAHEPHPCPLSLDEQYEAADTIADLTAALREMCASIEGYAQALADDQDGKEGTPLNTAVGTCILALNRARAALAKAEGGRK